MKLLLATRNPHKAGEIRRMLSDLPLTILSLSEFPRIRDVEEDGETLEDNASKKALAAAEGSGLWSLADDTGLEVEALGGAPGVRSARYAGEGCGYADNNRKLLRELQGVPESKRGAVLRCVMALSAPDLTLVLEEGRLGGIILEPVGHGGFGYDPVFYLPKRGSTLAELPIDEKNALSHRAKALARMRPRLARLAGGPGAFLAVSLGLAAAAAWAGRTEPGRQTVWDQLMAAQAVKEMRAGAEHLERREYAKAVREFAKAVAAQPQAADARLMLGVAYYWDAQVESAETEFLEALRLEPENPQGHLLLGIVRAWKGDAQAAHRSFLEAERLDAERPDVQMNLGSIEETFGLYPRALDHFRRAVSIDPKNPLYHFQLGALYRRLGRYADAGTSMREALRHAPEYEDALLELGASLEHEGEIRQARDFFRKAVRLKPRDAVARLRLARCRLLLGDFRGSRDAMRDAFHLTPEEAGGGLALSVSFGGKPREGREPGAQNPDRSDDPGKGAGPPRQDPAEIVSRNLERVPLDQEAVLQLQLAFLPPPKLVPSGRGDASSKLKRALESSSKPSPMGVQREFTLKAAGARERRAQIESIRKELAELVRQSPEDSELRMGMNLRFSKKPTPAGARGADAPAKVSYQPRAVGNDMGLWVLGTGWMTLVDEVLPQEGEEPDHPDEADWWVLDGLGYAALGDGRSALAAFDRAVRKNPEDEQALLGRGVAFVEMGLETEAIAAYRRLLSLHPTNKAAKEGLEWLLRAPASGRPGAAPAHEKNQ